MKTTASMFTGGGLFDIGAIQAGYTPIWGIEYDDKIAAVARLNNLPVLTADVCVVDYSQLQRPDHLHASPPCPNFSVAKNGRKETEQDIALADAVCRALKTLDPETFTLENVPAYIHSESFMRISKALNGMGYWWDVNNLNSADFGVPQTRLRLWVRASRQLLRGYPPPAKWVGWYQAIEDLIPSLPDTQFAPWQMARLPDEYKDMLFSAKDKGSEWGKGYRNFDEPALTVIANSRVKAFLIGGGNNNFADAYPGNGVRYEKDPSTTVTSDVSLTRFRAFIASSGNANSNTFAVRDETEPHQTVTASMDRTPSRAFILNGTTNDNGKDVTIRDSDQPIFTQKATGHKTPARTYANGRVVKMTVQALGRFQTVPDSYKGLTVKINGNGVPCLMAQRILETL